MNLYHDSGYFNVPGVLAQGYPFNFAVGGRGTGKTYGALKYCIDEGVTFMLMRRTQSQIDLINKPDFSPFKSLNRAEGRNIISQPVTKYNSAFYHGELGEDGKIRPTGAAIGYTCALSTVANLRGFDASDVDLLIYDEFIPERHERPIKNEGIALMNAYETINRNRELQGKKPLQLLCLANANDLGNAVFMEMGMVRVAEQMRIKGRELYTNRDRGLLLCILKGSPISESKKQTALYRLAGDSEFSRMSTGNEFSGEERSANGTRPLAEYNPLVTVGELTIYQHKHRRDLYATTHRRGSPPTYTAGQTDRARFIRAYLWIWEEYMRGKMSFEDYFCEVLFTKYCKV